MDKGRQIFSFGILSAMEKSAWSSKNHGGKCDGRQGYGCMLMRQKHEPCLKIKEASPTSM